MLTSKDSPVAFFRCHRIYSGVTHCQSSEPFNDNRSFSCFQRRRRWRFNRGMENCWRRAFIRAAITKPKIGKERSSGCRRRVVTIIRPISLRSSNSPFKVRVRRLPLWSWTVWEGVINSQGAMTCRRSIPVKVLMKAPSNPITNNRRRRMGVRRTLLWNTDQSNPQWGHWEWRRSITCPQRHCRKRRPPQ